MLQVPAPSKPSGRAPASKGNSPLPNTKWPENAFSHKLLNLKLAAWLAKVISAPAIWAQQCISFAEDLSEKHGALLQVQGIDWEKYCFVLAAALLETEGDQSRPLANENSCISMNGFLWFRW